MGRISMPQGRGNRIHNLRAYSNERMPKNIFTEHTYENVVWKDETIGYAYHRIFDDALKEYNERQKQPCRRIPNYHQHILNSKNGEHEFYEDVIQWGLKKDFEGNPGLREVAKECLLEYIENFQKRNPNLDLIGAYLHMDEASPHLHFDYIPVAHGYKRGLHTRNSLDRAMKEMGYGKYLRDKKDNATKQWKEAERKVFREICLKHNLVVEKEVPTPERESLSVLDYKKEQRAKEVRELEVLSKELKGEVLTSEQIYKIDITKPILSQRIKVYYQEMANLKATAIEVDDIRQENEKIKAESIKVVEKADEIKSEADQVLSERESILAKAHNQADQIVSDAHGRAEEEYDIAKSAFDEKREKMVASLQEEISGLKDQVSQLKINIKGLEMKANVILSETKIKAGQILEAAIARVGQLDVFKYLQDMLGLVNEKKMFEVRDKFERCYLDAIPYLDGMKQEDLLDDEVQKKLWRRVDHLDHEVCYHENDKQMQQEWRIMHSLSSSLDEYKEVVGKPATMEEVRSSLEHEKGKKRSVYIK